MYLVFCIFISHVYFKRTLVISMEKFLADEGIDTSHIFHGNYGSSIEIPEDARAIVVSGMLLRSLRNIQFSDGIRAISADRNAIEVIEWSGNEKNLTFLDISSNLISKLQNFQNMDRLRVLNASNNRISVIENIESCLSLRELSLAFNRIHSIFLTRPLFSLDRLDLSFNPLTDFPFSRLFPNLSVLRLERCFISDLRWVNDFKHLTELYLAGNKICDDDPLELPSLEVCDLSSNSITSLFIFDGLHSLRILNLSGNALANDGIEVDFTLSGLRRIDVSHTLITQILPLLKLAPRLERVEFADTAVTDFTEFISRQPNVTVLDLRGTPITEGLYFDRNEYEALSDYDRVFPAKSDERREYRKRILTQNPRLLRLDGIATGEERQGSESAQAVLARLIQEQNEIRKSMGLRPRDELPQNLSDINEWVALIRKETERLMRKFNGRKRFDAELEPLLKENARLREALHIETADTFTSSNIDEMIKHFTEANEALKLELEAKLANIKSRKYVYERCTKLIMAMAREKCETRRVENGSTEFHILQAFIASKVTAKIRLVEALRKDVHSRFTEMETKMKWLSLVVDDGSNSPVIFENGIHSPIVVADHMNHILHKLTKRKSAIFVICAFDNGKTVVDRTATNSLPDVSKYQCDTVLFHMRNSQFFYALNPERIVPLFLVKIALKTE